MRNKLLKIVLTAAVMGAAPAWAGAQKGRPDDAALMDGKEPAVLRRLNECRAITDDQRRLACFDAGVAELAAAQTSGEVAVVDRQQIRKARRGLFGFDLPSLNIFGSGKGDKTAAEAERDEVREIVSRIAGVTKNSDGYYIVTLEDGARWEQIAPMAFGRAPRSGSTITIKKAAMGSFKMQIDQSPPVRARRIG